MTAARLARELEVSERTIYRDIRDLQGSGTHIDGEAGVGYSLRAGYDLPPLMFDEAEIQALVLGARIAASFGDQELARASRSVLSKVESVLPRHLKPMLKKSALYAPLPLGAKVSKTLMPVRNAVVNKRKLSFAYTRMSDGEKTRRSVRPLGAFFWGKVWTMGAWCELRDDFRNFRIDKMSALEVLDESFEDEPGKTLNDYLRGLGDDPEAALID